MLALQQCRIRLLNTETALDKANKPPVLYVYLALLRIMSLEIITSLHHRLKLLRKSKVHAKGYNEGKLFSKNHHRPIHFVQDHWLRPAARRKRDPSPFIQRGVVVFSAFAAVMS
jgi:hypothetical protein